MAENCLAPGYLKLDYTSNGHTHTMTIPVIPSGSGASIEFEKKGGGTETPAVAIAALLAVVLPFFKTTDSFSAYEVFTQADCASAPVFQDGGSISGATGGSSAANQPWVQAVLTFRSALGGRAKIEMLEGVVAANQRLAISAAGAGSVTDLANYLVGSTSFVVARDGAYLSGKLNYTTKVNDTLRKKFLL